MVSPRLPGGPRSPIPRYLEAVMVFVSFVAALTVASAILLCAGNTGLCTAHLPSGSKKEARRGAVSSLDARCSAIGVAILTRGGNAADAVGTNPTLVVRWQRCGMLISISSRWSRRSSAAVSSVRGPVPFRPPFAPPARTDELRNGKACTSRG